MTGPYAYTADPSVITQLIVDKIELAKATFRVPVMDVYYGDQDLIPNTPSVCVETGDTTRALAGAPNMTQNDFEIYILVYHNRVQENQLTRKECDQIGYDITLLMHQDLQLTNGGPPNVIHGYIRSHESGYTRKKDTMYRSARLTWRGHNKTSLPVA